MTAVGIVGAGYVGLTSAASLAALGHEVLCADNDEAKVKCLNAAEIAIAEPGLGELVAEGLADGRLGFTTDLARLSGATVVLLCLPTPMGADGSADLAALESVLDRLAGVLPTGCVLVTKSTVPVGTTARLADRLGRPDVALVSNPEFLREGRAVHDFRHPDRIVVGADDEEAANRVALLYAGIDAPVLRLDPTSAELAKYAANAFLALKLSYVNEIAELCERIGGDVTAVADVLGRDGRIGPAFLSPGPGWGGSCLPKDTTALLRTAERAGMPFDLLRGALDANEESRERVVRKVRRAVTGDASGDLSGRPVGLLGLAFKAGTGDLRDSPALAVAERLAGEGAELTAYDPCVPPGTDVGSPVQVVDDPVLAAKDGDGLVLLTEWPEFAELDWARMAAVASNPVVVDARNMLDADLLARCGFAWTGVGRG